MRKNLEFDQTTAAALQLLDDQPDRDPIKARAGRAAFLEQAREMAAAYPAPVSAGRDLRHNRWNEKIKAIFTGYRKERSPMMSAITTFMIILSLALAGGGVTAAAAQQSLPDDGLYPVKVWTENVRMQMTNRDQASMQLALAFANRRSEELGMMLRAGQEPPVAVQERMRAEIDLALRYAAGLPEGEAQQALLQIREQLREHEQLFLQLGPGANAAEDAIIARVRTMLQERLQWSEEGLQDPTALQHRFRSQELEQPPVEQPGAGRTGTPERYGLTSTPAQGGFGPGPGGATIQPRLTGTPAPGNGAGPGPGGNEPGSGPGSTGEPSGTQNSYGPGPQQGTSQPDDGGSNDGSNNPGGNGAGWGDPGGNGSGGDDSGNQGGSGSGGSPGDSGGAAGAGGGEQGGGSGGSGGGSGGGGGKP